MASLASALARGEPQDRRVHVVAVPRPGLLVRALLATLLVLALVFAAAVLAAGAGFRGLVDAFAALRSERRLALSALPPEEVLADAAAARQAAAARPAAAAAIWRARCERLAAAGSWAAIEALCAEVSATRPEHLLPATRLLRAEALAALGRTADAARELHRLDADGLDPEGRRRAAELAGRLWLRDRP